MTKPTCTVVNMTAATGRTLQVAGILGGYHRFPDLMMVNRFNERVPEHRALDSMEDNLVLVRPRLVFWEDVRGIGSLRNERLLQARLDLLANHGYLARYKVLDDAAYGGRRGKRMWIIASNRRIDLPDQPKWPSRNPEAEIPADQDATLWALLRANHLLEVDQ